jgi:hypothetical protein
VGSGSSWSRRHRRMRFFICAGLLRSIINQLRVGFNAFLQASSEMVRVLRGNEALHGIQYPMCLILLA